MVEENAFSFQFAPLRCCLLHMYAFIIHLLALLRSVPKKDNGDDSHVDRAFIHSSIHPFIHSFIHSNSFIWTYSPWDYSPAKFVFFLLWSHHFAFFICNKAQNGVGKLSFKICFLCWVEQSVTTGQLFDCKFLRFSTTFGKKWRFFLKTMLWSKNADLFSNCLAKMDLTIVQKIVPVFFSNTY
jgi:hypothetical protein